MGTTAQKIQYLDGTKTLLKDTINLTGAGITNDTFRSYANKLKLGLINALNDNGDTIYSNLEKVSGKGSNLSLTPTYEAPMRNREIYGNTSQASTPSPSSPVPIQSVTGNQNIVISNSDNTDSNTYEVNLGKNLFDKNNANVLNAYFNLQQGIVSNANARSIYIPCKPNTTYTMQKNGSARFRIGTTDSVPIIGSSILNINSDDSASALTITTPSNAKYLIAYIYGYFDTNPKTFDEVLDTIQIEKGTQATSYSPYFTPIELNKIGTYEDSIKKSTGKQLFDKDNANILNGNLADGGTLSSTNNARTLYIPCKNNTTYTISKLQAVYFRVAQFTNVPQIGDSYISRTKDDLANSITFTTTTGNYLAVTYWYNTSTYTEQQVLDSLMINEGSTALPYEPYGKVWYIEKNTGDFTLKGNETWNGGTLANEYLYVYSNSYDNVLLPNVVHLGLSTHFKVLDQIINTYSPVITTDSMSLGSDTPTATNRIRVKINATYLSGSTVNDFKTWLSNNNVKVVYQLKTPTYTEITNTELIEQLETLYNAKSKNGTTNIVITSEDLAMIMNVNVIKGDA